jgi:hypothetical protein
MIMVFSIDEMGGSGCVGTWAWLYCTVKHGVRIWFASNAFGVNP